MKRRPIALWQSLICLLLCVSMLAGTTFAWFTDRVTTGVNTIAAGNLDVELYHSNATVQNEQVKTDTILFKDLNGNPILWEPGVVSYENLRVTNEGDLALQYRLAMETANENFLVYPDGTLCGLSQVLQVGVVEGGITATDRAAVVAAVDAANWTSLANFLRTGNLLPAGKGESEKTWGVVVYWQPGDNDNLWNLNNGKQLDTGSVLSIDLGVKLVATQLTDESDSFGPDYDQNATFPGVTGGSVSTQVPVENNIVTADTTLQGNGFKAFVPAGTKLADGATQLTFSVFEKDSSEANLTLDDQEEMYPLDVHIEGTAPDNDKPILVTIEKAMTIGLNIGNYKLYHVENGVANQMTAVAPAELDAHNEFTYDPATGDITLAMQTFSEVAMVAEEAKWEGGVNHSWYDANATELTIANADQLWSFSQIVGGMNGQTQNSFSGKTVKLIADINLGDKEAENNPDIIFYPIGYYNSEGTYKRTNTAITSGLRNFEGTFDGQGHAVSNFYHNTWEMKGDHNWYNPEAQYYRDGMGLFGRVYKGTVKNLTVKNFSSDGEIATTGVIAAYADGATFENIAIFDCNPRVYNIGNGGIVGCVGWYTKGETDKKVTFKNITVDNSNKISALWGSYDVACGGIVGQYYPTSGQTSAGKPANAGIDLINCHVSAQMDVYNDVCGNYQYYAYRYAGMLIGSIRENTTNDDGKTIPDMTGISATGCTVHFGDWNDYYYCELAVNGKASYTHDHKFSRLTQIAEIDIDNMEYLPLGETKPENIPTSGRVNYVIVKAKNGDGKFVHGDGTAYATCYHFVDGKVWNHTDAGKQDGIDENKDGIIDWKEDKILVYREFNQLFTGYGWGVTSKGLTDFVGVENMDITTGHEDSVVKFGGKGVTKLANGTPITIGSLFSLLDNGVKLVPGALTVSVNNLDEGNPVSATFVRDAENWENGTLTLAGTGKVQITIQDYYFCTPTTIEVTITERQPVEKFETKFTGDFLYRVGNKGTVKLSSLFAAKDGVTIGSVSVTVDALNGTGASGTYAPNATWTESTITFNGTGIVKVTIADNDYCKPTELILEVVDAENATTAVSGSNKNFVLLNNVTYNGTYLYYNNSTLYGNGFTFDITGADHSDLKNLSDTSSNKSAYCNIWMVSSRFDNVRIIGSVYPEVGMTADSNYGNAAIRTEGKCYITNSYIANCRVPLRIQGNTTLKNTIVDGGRYANIELRSGKLTLDGVTTINTVHKASNGTTDVIGFGIVIHDEATNASISVIDNGLKQYNWVGENKHQNVLTGQYLSSAYALIFNKSNNNSIYFNHSGDRYVNTGILCLSPDIEKDAISGIDDRYQQKVSGYDAWVLTYDNNKHSTWFNESIAINEVDFAPMQHPVVPKYSGNAAQTVEFTKGETYNFDTGVFTAEKFGQTLSISSVVVNGKQYSYGSKISITEGGVYEIIYTVVDPYNYNADGSAAAIVNHTETITVTAIAKDAEILAPKFTFIDQNGNKYESTTVKIGDKTYVMPNVTAADPTTNSMSSINIGSASISGTTVYFPIAQGYTVRSGSNFNRYYPMFNGINITDYTVAGDTTGTTYSTSGNYTSSVGSSGTKFIIPANSSQTNCGDYVKTSGQSGNAAGNSSSGWQGSGYSTSYDGTYLKSGSTSASSGNDANGYERIVWVEYSFNAGNGDVYYYRIGYHCNKESAQGGCITPDTLITLADGTQKRIDQVTYTDRLLAWDFFKGAFTSVSPAIIFDHGYGNNTVIELKFSDGTIVKAVTLHQFFDAGLNRLVTIDAQNVADYVGHKFAKKNGNGYKMVELVDYTVSQQYVDAWGIISAEHYNIFVEGMLSTDFMHEDYPLFNYFEVGKDMTYDQQKMDADIEKYGLYTYADFADYLTYEQFVAFNVQYFKIPVAKGVYTYEGILTLIDSYLNN